MESQCEDLVACPDLCVFSVVPPCPAQPSVWDVVQSSSEFPSEAPGTFPVGHKPSLQGWNLPSARWQPYCSSSGRMQRVRGGLERKFLRWDALVWGVCIAGHCKEDFWGTAFNLRRSGVVQTPFWHQSRVHRVAVTPEIWESQTRVDRKIYLSSFQCVL